MKEIRFTLMQKLDGTRAFFGMALIDSYGDVLFKELTDHLDTGRFNEVTEYVTVCAKCNVPVVDSSIVPDSGGLCDHCMPKNLNLMPMAFRIEKAVQDAEAAFWCKITEHFPDATDGAFLHSDMDEIVRTWVTHWVEMNVPAAANAEGWAEELHLHYKHDWTLHQTGGGCMVAATKPVLTDRTVLRYVAVTSDCIAIYVDKGPDSFLEAMEYSWTFGEHNPAELMERLSDFFGDLYNKNKLFDDLMTIGKSSYVM